MRLYHVCSPGYQRDMLTWRHPHLPLTTQSTIKTLRKLARASCCRSNFSICFRIWKSSPARALAQFSRNDSALCREQSRLTNITGNEGCVRYPTEGNNSSHELTTAMHHLPNCLAATNVSKSLQLGFKPW